MKKFYDYILLWNRMITILTFYYLLPMFIIYNYSNINITVFSFASCKVIALNIFLLLFSYDRDKFYFIFFITLTSLKKYYIHLLYHDMIIHNFLNVNLFQNKEIHYFVPKIFRSLGASIIFSPTMKSKP